MVTEMIIFTGSYKYPRLQPFTRNRKEIISRNSNFNNLLWNGPLTKDHNKVYRIFMFALQSQRHYHLGNLKSVWQMDWERLAIADAFGTESQIRSSNVQTWLLLYTPDLGSNTFLSLSEGASTLLPLFLPPRDCATLGLIFSSCFWFAVF